MLNVSVAKKYKNKTKQQKHIYNNQPIAGSLVLPIQ